MRYKNESKWKENGVVYTLTEMADYVATEIRGEQIFLL